MDLLAVAVGPLVLTLVVLALFFNLLRETRANKRLRSQLDKSTATIKQLTTAMQEQREAEQQLRDAEADFAAAKALNAELKAQMG